MKTVIMFSSLHSNPDINRRVSGLLQNKVIAHIPAGLYDQGYAYRFMAYKDMGFERTFTAPLGFHYDKDRMDAALECDAIHIGGGNTFELLYLLRHRGMIKKLRKFVDRGGILMGNSAGSIVMCPSIDIAQFADNNYMRLENLSSLGLVDFDMKPHWDYWEEHEEIFEKYQKNSKRDLYCLREDEAIFVSDGNVTFYGAPRKFA